MTVTRVAVIGGGRNCEHDVSLASATAVADALERAGHQAVRLTIDPAGAWRDRAGDPIGLAAAVGALGSCAVAFPVLHGPHGEDGTLAALCDLAGVPCVGSPLGAGALAMDKWVTKLVAGALGIATAPGRLLTRTDTYTFTHPVVVKPVAAGSSRGVTLVRHAARLGPALDAAFGYDDRVLVEDLVTGREIDVAVLGRPDGSRVVAPALEIVVPADAIFDHAAKYSGEPDFRVPAALDDAARDRLAEAAVRMYDALGCAGVARVDFFLTARGPVLNEVNTMPGLTAQSQVPRMFAASGMPFEALLDLLVRDAVPS
ncbi:D-alanine--D-alanine ligase family protein [Mangrovihabitans endophyticus]|uniref:D-alanine--D-alanine ligase n=1 Tax=Mangrovihabitans endophyticus TaxID=1751298 RepID=A0A8J3C2Z1_9ACTN|nr:D-alanine--D-alanine ligase family protein [Mangrovihabitans endophyticus]GGL02539.1 D-alanine--D-alanine ligase [Mangrovihabitans endophyticus]